MAERAATRLLTTAEQLGVLDLEERAEEVSVDEPAHRDVLRRAARESIVLMRNETAEGRAVLPLDPSSLERVAVIGAVADRATVLGGGSAAVNPHHVVTILDGLTSALGTEVELVHEPGVDPASSSPPLEARRCSNGIVLEYHDNRELAGEPVFTEQIGAARLIWLGDEPAPGVPAGDFSCRVRATFRADVGGPHTFSMITGGAGGRVLLDGAVLCDNFEDQQPGRAFFGLGSAEVRGTAELAAGATAEVVAEFVCHEGLPAAAFLVGHLPPIADDGIERAVAAAASSDVALVVVGLDQDSETEGEDRRTLSLPGRQDELVRAVCKANNRTVVLVNAGSVVDLDCADGAAALVQSWYLGQETGGAVADVLTGVVSPSGRLPMTYGRRVEDWPSWLNYPGEAGEVLYGEELFMGYRGFAERAVEPRFCFGHGLGYSPITWGDASTDRTEVAISAQEPIRGQAALSLSVELMNAGGEASAEVVQCYVHDSTDTRRRADQELRGFAKVHLEPGETATASIVLDERAFASWGVEQSAWVVAAGSYEIRLGASYDDIRAVLSVVVTDR